MADETMGTYTEKILVEPGAMAPQACKINGSTIKPGFVIHAIGETGGTDTGQRDVALMTNATFDVPYGVVGREPDNDIDTAYSDNDPVAVYRKNSAAKVWTFLKTSAGTAVYPGVPLYAPCDGGGAVDVLIKNATNDTTSLNRYNSDKRRFIGTADDTQAVSSGGWTCIKIILAGSGEGITGTG
jgi:hypothetical protein